MMHRLAERPDLDTRSRRKDARNIDQLRVRIVRNNERTHWKFDKMVYRSEITELNFSNKVVTSGSN